MFDEPGVTSNGCKDRSFDQIYFPTSVITIETRSPMPENLTKYDLDEGTLQEVAPVREWLKSGANWTKKKNAYIVENGDEADLSTLTEKLQGEARTKCEVEVGTELGFLRSQTKKEPVMKAVSGDIIIVSAHTDESVYVASTNHPQWMPLEPESFLFLKKDELLVVFDGGEIIIL